MYEYTMTPFIIILESKDLVTEYDKDYSWHSDGAWLRITHQRSFNTRGHHIRRSLHITRAGVFAG